MEEYGGLKKAKMHLVTKALEENKSFNAPPISNGALYQKKKLANDKECCIVLNNLIDVVTSSLKPKDRLNPDKLSSMRNGRFYFLQYIVDIISFYYIYYTFYNIDLGSFHIPVF